MIGPWACDRTSAGPGTFPAVVGAPEDSLAVVFGHCGKEGYEPAADGCGEVKVWLVSHLDQGSAFADAVDDGDAVAHRPGGAVPFGDDQDVAGAERINRLLELWPSLDVLRRSLVPEDFVTTLDTMGANLAVEVLVRGVETLA